MGFALIAGLSFSQQQIGNSDMETWETVASDSEPVNWNSFLSASGPQVGFADNQIEQSSDVRPGTTGTSSARIWSRGILFNTIIANGNVTLGRINMGSTTASNQENHNYTVTADPDFSEALQDSPDSLVIWVKFNADDGAEEAKVKAVIHDDYDYEDPEDAASGAHVVAVAVQEFTSTSGWVRLSIPFDYSGPSNTPEYILLTATTNKTPGGGDADDELFIDDIELIYNPAADVDSDGDGVLASAETTDGTSDSDPCDFVLASATETPSSAWDAADCDSDGVSNGQEVIDGTDPLVHNSASLSDLMADGIKVSYVNGSINIISENSFNGDYTVYNTLGKIVQNGVISNSVAFSADKGIYFVKLNNASKVYSFEILVD